MGSDLLLLNDRAANPGQRTTHIPCFPASCICCWWPGPNSPQRSKSCIMNGDPALPLAHWWRELWGKASWLLWGTHGELLSFWWPCALPGCSRSQLRHCAGLETRYESRWKCQTLYTHQHSNLCHHAEVQLNSRQKCLRAIPDSETQGDSPTFPGTHSLACKWRRESLCLICCDCLVSQCLV